MSPGFTAIIAALEDLAAYNGPWRVMRQETPLLHARLKELRERERRLDDVLLVALVGGSGVGKSTLLNALAGDKIAETSEMRPCTSVPTVYHPPGMQFSLSHLPGVRHVPRSALEHIALIDTPDSDTIVTTHRAIVEQVLQECDLILLCADSEKYLDYATWSLLEPLRGIRAMVCVETRVRRADDAVRNDWLTRLKEQGFEISGYFCVNALRAFDRKVAWTAPSPEEFDFAALEDFLRHKLDRERVSRIKTSNAVGLLAQTIRRLQDRLGRERNSLAHLSQVIDQHSQALVATLVRQVAFGVSAEPHIWVHALGREVSIRVKGGIGSVFKIVEWLHSLPYRLPNWFTLSPIPFSDEATGRMFLFPLTTSIAGDSKVPEPLSDAYQALHSDLRLHFVKAGFEIAEAPSLDPFVKDIEKQLRAIFTGPVQEGLTKRARILSSWPIMVLLDGLPLTLLGYVAWLTIVAFWRGDFLTGPTLLHTGVIFVLLVMAELTCFSLCVRFLAWTARYKGLRLLKQALAAPHLAFKKERDVLAEAERLLQTIEELQREIGSQ